MSDYPGSLDVFTDKEPKRDIVKAVDVNDLQDAIEAIEGAIGVNPQGTRATLITRLAIMMATNGALAQGTSFPGSPVDGQIFYRTDADLVYVYDGASWNVIGGSVSNVLFEWFSGYNSSFDADHRGYILGPSSDTPSVTGVVQAGAIYAIKSVINTNAHPFHSTKWTKSPGVQTITVKVRAWCDLDHAIVSADIGGATGSVTGTVAVGAPEWLSFTVDVSGLVNNTTYDAVFSIRNDGINSTSYVDTLIAMGA